MNLSKKKILTRWWSRLAGGISNITIPFSSGVFTGSYTYSNEPNQEPQILDATISGTLQEGEFLTATVNEYVTNSPYSLSSYSYQWYRSDDIKSTNRAAISGATSSTYTLVTADVGRYIDCSIILTLDGGQNPNSNPYITRMTDVVAGSTASIIINFRRDADATGAPKAPDTAINELTHVTTSISAGSVVDSQGNIVAGVGLSLTSVGGLPGLANGNLVDNTTRFSDESLDTHLNSVKTAGAETLTISGLNDANTYSIEFMGTESSGATNFNRIGTITAGGVSGTDETSGTYDAYQQTATVTLSNLSTDGAGNLLVIFTSTGTAGSNNWLPMSSIAIDGI